MNKKRSMRSEEAAGTQRKGPGRTEPGSQAETTSQFTLKLRASLHRELAVLAFESGMTMRGFVMNALKSQGLNVTEEDLVDRRRR